MRQDLREMLAERRKALRERSEQDPRLRTLARLGAGRALPPRTTSRPAPLALPVVAVIAAVALMACVATAVAVAIGGNWVQNSLADPTTTVQSFFAAIQRSDYRQAYTYFSASAQAQVSESAFTDQFAGYDGLDGHVVRVSLASPAIGANGNTAVVVAAVVRRSDMSRAQIFSVSLVKEQGAWHIQSITINANAAPAPTLGP